MKPKVIAGEGSEWLSAEESRNQRRRIVEGDQEEEEEVNRVVVGLYGYRRQTLCGVLLGMVVLVMVNLGMTLWMLTVMEFSAGGLGPLTILRRGVELHGKAVVMDKLIASKVASRKGQPIKVESSAGISLIARGEGGRENRLVLADDQLQVHASGVRISDSLGKILFSADRKEVLVGADQLKVTGDGGAIFHGSVQTPLIRSGSGRELRLESPTRGINVIASHGVAVESRAGDLSAVSLQEFRLQSKAGSIKLDAHNVFLGKLPVAQVQGAKLPAAGLPVEEEGEQEGDGGQPLTLSRSAIARGKPEVFMVCICGGKGRVFLAPAEGPCLADAELCR